MATKKTTKNGKKKGGKWGEGNERLSREPSVMLPRIGEQLQPMLEKVERIQLRAESENYGDKATAKKAAKVLKALTQAQALTNA